MAKSTLFATALLGVCATASPLIKKDNGDDASSGTCFNATIRKEFLLQIKTYEPKDPYGSAATNVNQVRLNIADPTNQDQNAITCTDAAWNSTQQSFPTEYLPCSDPTLSYKLTSHEDFRTMSLIINQTFVQGSFSETILASYSATENELLGNSCTSKGCGAWFINGEQGHAKVYDVQKNGPPSTPFPEQCPPNPLPTVSNWPIRYASYGPKDPADTSSTIYSQVGFDILANAQNGWRVKCNGPAWDSTAQAPQPADWYPCPEIEYIPGNWSFRVEAYTGYNTFNLGIKQNICNEVQCQDNLAYANLTVATQDPDYSGCDGQGRCTSDSGWKTVDAPVYAVVNVTSIE